MNAMLRVCEFGVAIAVVGLVGSYFAPSREGAIVAATIGCWSLIVSLARAFQRPDKDPLELLEAAVTKSTSGILLVRKGDTYSAYHTPLDVTESKMIREGADSVLELLVKLPE